MIWIVVFAGIAVAGLIVLIASAVWLMHKTSDLYSEVRMLGKRVTEAAELLSAIQLPEDRESTLEAANRSGNRLEREGN